jgi:tellurite resistance protein TerC
VKKRLSWTYRWARRIAIAALGGTVLLVGIAMVVLPGPALVVIPVGLGILGLEFAFARRWLKALKEKGAYVAGRVKQAASRSPPDAS